MQIKFYKNSNGNYVLTDVKGRDEHIQKYVLMSASTGDGNVYMHILPSASHRFSNVEGLHLLEDVIDADGNPYTEETFNTLLDDFYKIEEPVRWKTYKALISQSGEDTPIARVLNQDEPDYLGYIEYVRESVGVFRLNNEKLISSNLIYINIIDQWSNRDNYFIIDKEESSEGIIFFQVRNKISGETVDTFDGCYIEIKVRQRGVSPVLLSAETNEAGDKVILTFNKRMSEYGLQDVGFVFNASDTGAGGGGNVIINPENNSQLIYNIEDGGVSLIDVITTGLTVDFKVESFDYGLLQPFENFPVTNNVVAAP